MAIEAEPCPMEQSPELTLAGNDRVALERELIQLGELLLEKGAITRDAFAKLVELRVGPSARPATSLSLVAEDA